MDSINLLIPDNLIEKWTEKAVLIKLPKKKYKFWVSRKLLKIYKNSYSLYVREDYVFIAKTDGGKQWELGFDELLDYFTEIKPKYETHKPQILQPIKTEALQELKDE